MSDKVNVIKKLNTLFPNSKVTAIGTSQLRVHVKELGKFNLNSLSDMSKIHEVSDIGLKRSGTGITILIDL